MSRETALEENLSREADSLIQQPNAIREAPFTVAQLHSKIRTRRTVQRRWRCSALGIGLVSAVVFFSDHPPDIVPEEVVSAEVRSNIGQEPAHPESRRVEVYATWQSYEPVLVVDQESQTIQGAGWVETLHRAPVQWEQLPESRRHAVMNVMYGIENGVELYDL